MTSKQKVTESSQSLVLKNCFAVLMLQCVFCAYKDVLELKESDHAFIVAQLAVTSAMMEGEYLRQAVLSA